MLERRQGIVTLHDVDVEALRQLIEYTYTGELTITEDNVQVLLPASSLLQIQSVPEACCKFLLRQLHPSNVLGIRSFAGRLHFFFFFNIISNLNFVLLFKMPIAARNFIHALINTLSKIFNKSSALKNSCYCHSTKLEI